MLSRAKSCELVIDEHDPDATPLNFAQNSNSSKPDSCSACDLQLSDGVLSIAGDRGDNVVQVEDQGNQVVSVVCFDQGDDIPDADVFRGVTSVIARLAAGNDTFEHRSKHPSVANVQALLGEGEDTGLVEMVAGADSAREMHVEMHDGEDMRLSYQTREGLVSLQANGGTSTTNPDCLAWDIVGQNVYEASINVGNVAVELGGHIDRTTEAIVRPEHVEIHNAEEMSLKYQTSGGLVSLQATGYSTADPGCLAWDIVGDDVYESSINVGNVAVEVGGPIVGTSEVVVRGSDVKIKQAMVGEFDSAEIHAIGVDDSPMSVKYTMFQEDGKPIRAALESEGFANADFEFQTHDWRGNPLVARGSASADKRPEIARLTWGFGGSTPRATDLSFGNQNVDHAEIELLGAQEKLSVLVGEDGVSSTDTNKVAIALRFEESQRHVDLNVENHRDVEAQINLEGDVDDQIKVNLQSNTFISKWKMASFDGKGHDVTEMEFGSLRSDGDLVQATSEVAFGDNLVSIEATDYGDVGGGEDDFTITASGGRNTAQIDTGDSRLAVEAEGEVHVQAKKTTKKKAAKKKTTRSAKIDLQLAGDRAPAVVDAEGFHKSDIRLIGSDRDDAVFVRLVPAADSDRTSKVVFDGADGHDLAAVKIEGEVADRVRISLNGRRGNDQLLVDASEAKIQAAGQLVVRTQGQRGNDEARASSRSAKTMASSTCVSQEVRETIRF